MTAGHMAPRILIADDEEDVRYIIGKLLEEEGFEAVNARDGEEALGIMRQGIPDVVLLDITMPRVDGMQVLKEASAADTNMPVIMLTSDSRIASAVEAVKSGAYDYQAKPFDNEELILKVRRALESHQLREENRRLRSKTDRELPLAETMGPSDQVRKIEADVARVAPTGFAVVIVGETGSGKELVANAIHRLDTRASGPFVPVDCGSIPETLIESEFFGHEKGSFTGADRARLGLFEQADGGTLFLDEVSNMPLLMQTKFLRAVQEKEICRVGGAKHVNVDVRLIAATNRDLGSMVADGSFRQDLYHRLNEFSIRLPGLRDRRDDLIFLAKRFLDLTNVELDKNVHGVSEDALEALLRYQWPGNVRELRNAIRRATLLADTIITPEHLSLGNSRLRGKPHVPGPGDGFDFTAPLKHIVRESVEHVERSVLSEVLRHTGGNKAEAARMLQIDYKTMHTKVKHYGISVGGDGQTRGKLPGTP